MASTLAICRFVFVFFLCICSLTCASACICYNLFISIYLPSPYFLFVFLHCILICLMVNERINLKGNPITETSSRKKGAEAALIVCLLNSATDRERICKLVFSYSFRRNLFLYLIHLQISSFCICVLFMCK